MKNTSLRERTSSPVSGAPKNLRVLKKYVRELRALLVEATTILNDLVLNPSAEIVRHLCAQFSILQDYFAVRYQQARTCAIATLGHIEAVWSFP